MTPSSLVALFKDTLPVPLLTRLGIARFRIFLRVVPLALLAVMLRVVLEYSCGFTGMIESSSVTPFAATCMFVVAIMMAGVLEDYKDATRIPAAIAIQLDAICERIELARVSVARAKRRAIKELAHIEHARVHSHDLPPSASRLDALTECALSEEPDWRGLHGELQSFITVQLEYLAGLRSEHAMFTYASSVSSFVASSLEAIGDLSGVDLDDAGYVVKRFNAIRESFSRISVIKVSGCGACAVLSQMTKPFKNFPMLVVASERMSRTLCGPSSVLLMGQRCAKRDYSHYNQTLPMFLPLTPLLPITTQSLSAPTSCLRVQSSCTQSSLSPSPSSSSRRTRPPSRHRGGGGVL